MRHPRRCNAAYVAKGLPELRENQFDGEGRHVKGDWSEPDYEKYPKLAQAVATEVLLEAGDVLYLPSYWFHYIISTGTSAQCNTRSGAAIRGRDIIRECGFY